MSASSLAIWSSTMPSVVVLGAGRAESDALMSTRAKLEAAEYLLAIDDFSQASVYACSTLSLIWSLRGVSATATLGLLAAGISNSLFRSTSAALRLPTIGV